jgi:hypothetical protein
MFGALRKPISVMGSCEVGQTKKQKKTTTTTTRQPTARPQTIHIYVLS